MAGGDADLRRRLEPGASMAGRAWRRESHAGARGLGARGGRRGVRQPTRLGDQLAAYRAHLWAADGLRQPLRPARRQVRLFLFQMSRSSNLNWVSFEADTYFQPGELGA